MTRVQPPPGRESHIFDISTTSRSAADKTKYEAVDILRTFEVPCAPVLSMKEIATIQRCARAEASSKSNTRSAAPPDVGAPSSLRVHADDYRIAAPRRAQRGRSRRTGVRPRRYRKMQRRAVV